MAFEFYDFDEIKAAADCRVIARELGLTVKDDRCAATWRGGSNKTSVHLTDKGYYDHAREEGGSVIDLVAVVLYNGLIHEAQRWLGQRLGLRPTAYAQPPREHTRYQALLDEGYHEAARYRYTDAEGNLIHQVVRMEHPAQGKEFLQADGGGRWSTKHVEQVLYNLPAVSASPWAVVVEGEKDADTLIAHGIPATTNAGGAKKWQDSFSDALAGKDIILLPDNDDAGQAHLAVVGKSLSGKAKSIRWLTISRLPKGDVTDWFSQEGGTPAALLDAIRTAPAFVAPHEDAMALAAAKEANRKPLRNYELVKTQDAKGKPKTEKEPRLSHHILDDIRQRFLDFPRTLGGELFDHDKDTREIEFLRTPADLFGWMADKSKNRVEWARGDGFLTKDETLSNLRRTARRYEAISNVPDYPRRSDVYYSHPPLPDASPTHAALNGLLDFFAPAAPEYRTLLAALFAAPIYYRPGIPRPMWVIDSEDGAGTGKTTIAEMVAELYATDPVQVTKVDLATRMEELVKRLVSSTGRQARVLLLDNITGQFRSESLAGLVTRSTITGRAPYGRGEESRPNNLTYIITANSASLDNDLAVRSFFLFVRRTNVSGMWKSRLKNYIRQHRLAIFADILDVLTRGAAFTAPATTRFPEFEETVLQPFCANEAEYRAVLHVLADRRDEANNEDDLAHHVAETLIEALTRAGVHDVHNTAVFIHSAVADEWLADIIPAEYGQRGAVQVVRNLAKNGILKTVDPAVRRWPARGENRRSGLLWRPNKERNVLLAVGGHPRNPRLIQLLEAI